MSLEGGGRGSDSPINLASTAKRARSFWLWDVGAATGGGSHHGAKSNRGRRDMNGASDAPRNENEDEVGDDRWDVASVQREWVRENSIRRQQLEGTGTLSPAAFLSLEDDEMSSSSSAGGGDDDDADSVFDSVDMTSSSSAAPRKAASGNGIHESDVVLDETPGKLSSFYLRVMHGYREAIASGTIVVEQNPLAFATTSLQQQGDPSMYSDEQLQRRLALQQDPKVLRLIDHVWDAMPKRGEVKKSPSASTMLLQPPVATSAQQRRRSSATPTTSALHSPPSQSPVPPPLSLNNASFSAADAGGASAGGGRQDSATPDAALASSVLPSTSNSSGPEQFINFNMFRALSAYVFRRLVPDGEPDDLLRHVDSDWISYASPPNAAPAASSSPPPAASQNTAVGGHASGGDSFRAVSPAAAEKQATPGNLSSGDTVGSVSKLKARRFWLMNKAQFRKAMFSVVDVWTVSTDGDEYRDFVEQVLLRQAKKLTWVDPNVFFNVRKNVFAKGAFHKKRGRKPPPPVERGRSPSRTPRASPASQSLAVETSGRGLDNSLLLGGGAAPPASSPHRRASASVSPRRASEATPNRQSPSQQVSGDRIPSAVVEGQKASAALRPSTPVFKFPVDATPQAPSESEVVSDGAAAEAALKPRAPAPRQRNRNPQRINVYCIEANTKHHLGPMITPAAHSVRHRLQQLLAQSAAAATMNHSASGDTAAQPLQPAAFRVFTLHDALTEPMEYDERDFNANVKKVLANDKEALQDLKKRTKASGGPLVHVRISVQTIETLKCPLYANRFRGAAKRRRSPSSAAAAAAAAAAGTAVESAGGVGEEEDDGDDDEPPQVVRPEELAVRLKMPDPKKRLSKEPAGATLLTSACIVDDNLLDNDARFAPNFLRYTLPTGERLLIAPYSRVEEALTHVVQESEDTFAGGADEEEPRHVAHGSEVQPRDMISIPNADDDLQTFLRPSALVDSSGAGGGGVATCAAAATTTFVPTAPTSRTGATSREAPNLQHPSKPQRTSADRGGRQPNNLLSSDPMRLVGRRFSRQQATESNATGIINASAAVVFAAHGSNRRRSPAERRNTGSPSEPSSSRGPSRTENVPFRQQYTDLSGHGALKGRKFCANRLQSQEWGGQDANGRSTDAADYAAVVMLDDRGGVSSQAHPLRAAVRGGGGAGRLVPMIDASAPPLVDVRHVSLHNSTRGPQPPRFPVIPTPCAFAERHRHFRQECGEVIGADILLAAAANRKQEDEARIREMKEEEQRRQLLARHLQRQSEKFDVENGGGLLGGGQCDSVRAQEGSSNTNAAAATNGATLCDAGTKKAVTHPHPPHLHPHSARLETPSNMEPLTKSLQQGHAAIPPMEPTPRLGVAPDGVRGTLPPGALQQLRQMVPKLVPTTKAGKLVVVEPVKAAVPQPPNNVRACIPGPPRGQPKHPVLLKVYQPYDRPVVDHALTGPLLDTNDVGDDDNDHHDHRAVPSALRLQAATARKRPGSPLEAVVCGDPHRYPKALGALATAAAAAARDANYESFLSSLPTTFRELLREAPTRPLNTGDLLRCQPPPTNEELLLLSLVTARLKEPAVREAEEQVLLALGGGASVTAAVASTPQQLFLPAPPSAPPLNNNNNVSPQLSRQGQSGVNGCSPSDATGGRSEYGISEVAQRAGGCSHRHHVDFNQQLHILSRTLMLEAPSDARGDLLHSVVPGRHPQRLKVGQHPCAASELLVPSSSVGGVSPQSMIVWSSMVPERTRGVAPDVIAPAPPLQLQSAAMTLPPIHALQPQNRSQSSVLDRADAYYAEKLLGYCQGRDTNPEQRFLKLTADALLSQNQAAVLTDFGRGASRAERDSKKTLSELPGTATGDAALLEECALVSGLTTNLLATRICRETLRATKPSRLGDLASNVSSRAAGSGTLRKFSEGS